MIESGTVVTNAEPRLQLIWQMDVKWCVIFTSGCMTVHSIATQFANDSANLVCVQT